MPQPAFPLSTRQPRPLPSAAAAKRASNDGTIRDAIWRCFAGDDWTAFDQLPAAIRRRLDDDAVLLNAGCLCCTVRGDLVKALRRLRDRMDGGQGVRSVLVETTGLADPAHILHTLMTDTFVPGTFRLDGVVTVVDAVAGAATLDRQPEAVKQAAIADRLIVSKADGESAEAVAYTACRDVRLWTAALTDRSSPAPIPP